MNDQQLKEEGSWSSSESQEMNQIPVNKSMIQADTSSRTKKGRKKKRNKNKANNNRERSNTTEEKLTKIPENSKNSISQMVQEEYMGDSKDDIKPENNLTKDSTDNSADDGAKDKKSSLFISRCEDDEESKMFNDSSQQEFDVITELESKISTTSRESMFENIQELYLGEPKWSKSSSWVKPMPHRVYKIKTVWSEINRFDTEVRRRYMHFIWLRKMLLKDFEHCAVPVLPDKSIFERISSHESDFIKERIRKMKHFLTLVRSHRKLQQSDCLKAFLWENDKIFKATIKNLKLLEESDKSPVVQKTKGWLSSASTSFSKILTKSSTFNIENIIPGVKNLLSSTDEDYDAGSLMVAKFSEKLEVLKQSFIDLYKLATNIHISRSHEWKLERGLFHALDNVHALDSKDVQNMVDKNGIIAKIRGNEAYNNLVQIEELIYATESHLVWIESVQDLVNRKNDISDKLVELRTTMKEGPLNHHEIESCKFLLLLTERRDKMIKGIRKEMLLLNTGTKDFYPRYISNGFIISQQEFYYKSSSVYSN